MYSKELIIEVKELYRDSPEVMRLAESGSPHLGSYLQTPAVVSVDSILNAVSLEDIQMTARIVKRKIRLYEMWVRERK